MRGGMALLSDNVVATLIVTLPTIITSVVSAWAIVHKTGKRIEKENVKQSETLKQEMLGKTFTPSATPIYREPPIKRVISREAPL